MPFIDAPQGPKELETVKPNKPPELHEAVVPVKTFKLKIKKLSVP